MFSHIRNERLASKCINVTIEWSSTCIRWRLTSCDLVDLSYQTITKSDQDLVVARRLIAEIFINTRHPQTPCFGPRRRQEIGSRKWLQMRTPANGCGSGASVGFVDAVERARIGVTPGKRVFRPGSRPFRLEPPNLAFHIYVVMCSFSLRAGTG